MEADARHSTAGSDSFAVLGWGLRRYAWVVALCVLALGVLVPSVLGRAPQRWDAQAQVGPSAPLTLPNPNLLPRSAEAVFVNGVVAAAVRKSFQKPLPASVPVIPKYVELVAPQDNFVLNVVGHGPDAQSAKNLANVAARAFTQELNKYSRMAGAFAVQTPATAPARPAPTVGRPLSVGLGILAGLVAGLGLVVALLAWRRPVVDATSAQEVTGAPAFGSIRLAWGSGGVRGLPRLCHGLQASHSDLLLLAGPPETLPERRRLARELTRALSKVRPVKLFSGGDLSGVDAFPARAGVSGGTGERSAEPALVIVDEPTDVELATRPADSLSLLVVREGVSSVSLHRQAEEYLDPGETGLVLVSSSRLDPRGWFPRMRSAHSTSTAASVVRSGAS